MSKIIWIDLGTTNSCVAYMLNEKAEVIANAEWDRTTPSIVYIKGDQLLVWKLAKRKAALEPTNVVYEVKRFIGRTYDEAIDDIKSVPYEVKKWSDGGIILIIDGKEYKPEQISSMILKKIKDDCEKFLGDTVTEAVITVPAYFNDSQRNATKVAGEMAGLKVQRIINEPTAAALNYWSGKTVNQKVAIFDLWGGTFDVTIMEISTIDGESQYEVKATSGDTHLWGADFDQRIINWILESFKMKEGVDLSKNAMALQRIKDEAEMAKKQLSQADSVDINIPFITTIEGTPKHIQETLTRSQFEKLIGDLLERCRRPVLSALKDSKYSASEINEVILVWWSTRVPSVINIVKEIFGQEPKATVNPDEAVALGASIQWWVIKGDVKDILLLDVTPLSLAVEVEWGIAHPMITRNTTIPVKKSNTYTTAIDNQPAVTIHITQWERQFSKDNKSLGMFNLEGIPPMRRWQPQIEVTFDIDANGILHVTAKELSTGKSQNITVQWATGVSDEEIKKAQEDAEKFAADDQKRKEIIESKNRLEATLYQMESMLTENKEKIPAEEQDKINKLIADAKEIKENPNYTKDEIDEKSKAIQDEFIVLYQKYGAKDSSQHANPDDIISPDQSQWWSEPQEAEVIKS
jgi:molecular chaperone DnaK